MRWTLRTGIVCVLFACTGVVMATGQADPVHKWATHQESAALQAQQKEASGELSLANPGVVPAAATTAAPAEATAASVERLQSRIERSPDGASFRIDGGLAPERAFDLAETTRSEKSGSREGCGDPESGSCCEATYTPYCEDYDCCDLVCNMLGFSWCCDEGEEGGWDSDCVWAAREYCGICGPPMGACCTGTDCVDTDEMSCILGGGRWYHSTNCGELECPGCPVEESLYSQNVSNWGTYFGTTCDLDSGYSISYDRFWGVQGDICGVRWTGTPQDQDGWECYEDPMTFEIKFFEDAGGVPGAEVCSYTETVAGRMFGNYWWFEYEVELPTCCTLEEGFISIAGTGGPDCLFGWIAAEDGEGDGTKCTWSEEGGWSCLDPSEPWAFDVNFCLLGTPYPGACCDEAAGTCDDGVEAADCPETSRFAPQTLCAELDPPCGTLAGACCTDEPPYCYHEAEANCEGDYVGHGTTCDPTDCNTNGVPDMCDIASGNSADCDENGVPDECDIAGGGDDYDGNGVLDACEPDCNANGVVDACDISCFVGSCGTHPGGCGASVDCQPNGVPDECELGTLGDSTLWDNGAPNNTYVLRSHFGGSYEDALTVDDFDLPSGGIVNDLHWEVEETETFDWQGFVHVFLFGDNGSAAPDDANEIMHITVPGDAGVIVKTWLGSGVLLDNRYRYDIYGLDIPLEAGTYWLGLAPDGGDTDYGNGEDSKWCSSQAGGAVIGGEAHVRVPQVGYDFFEPWTNLGSSQPYDAAFTVTTTFYGADCNTNGIPDDCDIAGCGGDAWCQDCQGNGILDGCEPDCNANGVADQCDILDCDGSTWCSDCDANEVPDECQVPPLGTELDCNTNGSPDTCDIADGVSPDCNNNGIPDECDVASGFSEDYDGNNVPDECDPDCNENDVVDACDISCATGTCGTHPGGCGISLDCQPDGVPDECQLFTEWPYVIEDGSMDNSTGLSAGGTLAWLNQFVVQDNITTISSISLAWGGVAAGTPCTVYLWSDPDNDGEPYDAVVLASAATVVANPETGIFTTVDIADTYVGPNGTNFYVGAVLTHAVGEHPAAMDYDGWGTGWVAGNTSGGIDPNDLAAAPVALQPYTSGWLVRAMGLNDNDCNDNLIPDECDIASGFSQDCDANGMPDECEWLDCNSNGVHDPCDLLTCDGSAWCSDCNFNNVIDVCDIASGVSEDCHTDGVPDECQLGGSYTVLEETFYSDSFWEEPPPEGWESVTVAGDPWTEWVVYGGWGCEGQGGAIIWGNMEGKAEEGQSGGRGPLDVYLLSPELNLTAGVLSFCTVGCASGAESWCDEQLDVMIVVGDIGGGDDVFVGSASDFWVGYYEEFAYGEFELTSFLPGGPFRIAFRYHGDADEFDNVLVDQVVVSQAQPGSDCNDDDVPDDCQLRDCDGSAWCDDCNTDGVLDGCQLGDTGGYVYQWDDGSVEGGFGYGITADNVWVQRFDTQEGSETIKAIATTFGSPGGDAGVALGDKFSVFVWSDPWGMGEFSEAVLLAQASATVNASAINTGVLQTVPIGPVTVSGSFFIGASVVSAEVPAPGDVSQPLAHESWIAFVEGGTFDPTDIGSAEVVNMDWWQPVDWVLRAITPSTVPSNDCNENGIPDECELCGDLNGDTEVDYDDYVIFLDAFGGVADGSPPEDYCCDYDDSGAVGMGDYGAWLECYRDFIGNPTAGPPEKPFGNIRPIEPVGGGQQIQRVPSVRP